ncbi:hypothetical protein [Clostridium chrysemydis]|uniref:hypothetical protein n=1 Tax=Clostridium chrysemydis TaxID=2665504 RepID=UPI0018842084|nr:hypothetical protein [Clostridium chrysemydis]
MKKRNKITNIIHNCLWITCLKLVDTAVDNIWKIGNDIRKDNISKKNVEKG